VSITQDLASTFFENEYSNLFVNCRHNFVMWIPLRDSLADGLS